MQMQIGKLENINTLHNAHLGQCKSLILAKICSNQCSTVRYHSVLIPRDSALARSLDSGHQQLISLVDTPKGLRRPTKVGMMLFNELPECLLDRRLGCPRPQPKHRKRFMAAIP